MAKLERGVNDLATVCPDIAAEWHPTKNGDLTPSDVTCGSSKIRVCWRCKYGHEWEASVSNRVKGTGCPVCADHVVLFGFNDLQTKFPNIASEWHPIKNGNLKPTDVVPGSRKRVFWCCKYGHEWEAPVYSRARGFGCPFCAGRVVIPGVNDLQTRYPEIAAEWHPIKNGKLNPSDVMPGSSKRVYWRCKYGHEWRAIVNSRTAGNGCPVCAGQTVLSGVNDLQTRYPGIAAEWHPIKNGDLKPDAVMPNCNKKIYWRCKYGHEWRAPVYSRIRGCGCPVCAGKVVRPGVNDLQTKRPDIAAEWHPTKNGNLRPIDVAVYSNKKFYWRCKHGHEWENTVSNRTKNGQGCPVCSEERKTSFAEQAVLFYVRSIFPDTVSRSRDCGVELDIFVPSMRVAIEYDGVFYHDGDDAVQRERKKNKICIDNDIRLIRIRENGLCSYNDCVCYFREDNRSNQSLSDVIAAVLNDVFGNAVDVDVERDRSLIWDGYFASEKEHSLAEAYPDIAAEWHPTKNGHLKPIDVLARSNKKVFWRCKYGHEWEASVCSRTSGYGCTVCSGRVALLGFNDLQTQYPEIAAEWHPTKNGDLKPTDVRPGSSKKVYWLCKYGHEWRTSISNRTKGTGCPVCAGNAVLSGFNDLQTKFPEIASQWHIAKNGDLKPTDVMPGSGKKVCWVCEYGHEWWAPVSSRTKGFGCPVCANQAKYKRICCVETGVIYDGIVVAANALNMSYSSISACLRGRYKTAGGYHWKYADDV